MWESGYTEPSALWFRKSLRPSLNLLSSLLHSLSARLEGIQRTVPSWKKGLVEMLVRGFWVRILSHQVLVHPPESQVHSGDNEPRVVAHSHNPSSWKAETEELLQI